MTGVNAPSCEADNESRVGPEMPLSPEATAEAVDTLEPSVGQQLRTAREAKGLTTDDVAKAIKLSLRQVKSLEADDWPNLPCNTIIRGFVRNYARLLGLDSDQLMGVLDRLTMPQPHELGIPTGPPVNLQKDGKADRRDYFRVFAGLFVLLLAVSAYFLVSQDVWDSALSAIKSATQSPVAVPAPVVAPGTVENKAPESGQAATTTAVPVQESTSLPSAQPAPTAEPSPSSDSGLHFGFTQPAWVEVRDRHGSVIFSQLCQANSQRDIEGSPPYTLVIGNSSHVTLKYQGKVVDLSMRSKDDVARLTLE
ncbi:RodZ domain-containing protein [Propionivibrio sp.]|uniref:RodZ domain-containing protein n=1 Tax=Propionivibrio sp. TaxID=2212460 RepID=UPI0025D12CB6|nr:RodZ domain-containing protein [Propionivibrio sp.]MBK8743953.1 helix-turn-helix domain-containing protein [Propionivibrio sp.]MBK8892955.1 helix-turn-helix domain-containing protein [Propionivibrio sp.]MBL0207358.1 helix-turn-helix domain-containing protein [Propionivibrio sp.]